jgi:hypothetical protein
VYHLPVLRGPEIPQARVQLGVQDGQRLRPAAQIRLPGRFLAAGGAACLGVGQAPTPRNAARRSGYLAGRYADWWPGRRRPRESGSRARPGSACSAWRWVVECMITHLTCPNK